MQKNIIKHNNYHAFCVIKQNAARHLAQTALNFIEAVIKMIRLHVTFRFTLNFNYRSLYLAEHVNGIHFDAGFVTALSTLLLSGKQAQVAGKIMKNIVKRERISRLTYGGPGCRPERLQNRHSLVNGRLGQSGRGLKRSFWVDG
ncbi:hypothetical protein ACWXWL_15115 [Pantoea ananatis]|jgi:hypothetical protein